MRLEEVAQAVGGCYRWLRMPLKPALGGGDTGAGRRLGALEGGRVRTEKRRAVRTIPPPPRAMSFYSGCGRELGVLPALDAFFPQVPAHRSRTSCGANSIGSQEGHHCCPR